MSEEHVNVPARFALAGLLLPGMRQAAEIAAKRQVAIRLGIHDEALRLARTTEYSYSEWVDRLALAIEVGKHIKGESSR